MFDKICTKLCLHTRKARIAFFSSLFFIMSITVLAALSLYEPQAMLPPQAVANFNPSALQETFRGEFGAEEGNRLFSFVKGKAEAGDNLLKQNALLQQEAPFTKNKTLTAEAARKKMAQQRENWTTEYTVLVNAEDPYIKALVEDIDEAQQLALDGMARYTPFINQRLFRARGMFHDLSSVLLAQDKSDDYYGDTRLGRLVEQEGQP
jgi:hypothetical protein